MSGARQAGAAEIRDRYSSMLYKMKSLKLAVNERRNQMQTVQQAGGTRRRKSAKVQPPTYITALQHAVERDLVILRQDFESGKTAAGYTDQELPQLDKLVTDLEHNFRQIVHSLYVSADPETDESDDDRSAGDPDAPGRGGEGADPEAVGAGTSPSRTSLLLPDIKLTSPSLVVNPLEVLDRVDRRRSQTESVEPLPPTLVTDSSQASVLKNKLVPESARRRDSFLKGTNVEYPLNSSFPRVTPVNGRSFSLPIIDSASSGGSVKKRFSRINAAMALREKGWRY